MTGFNLEEMGLKEFPRIEQQVKKWTSAVRPLSEILQTSDFQGHAMNKGSGIKTYMMIPNDEKTLEKDFFLKVKEEITRRQKQRKLMFKSNYLCQKFENNEGKNFDCVDSSALCFDVKSLSIDDLSFDLDPLVSVLQLESKEMVKKEVLQHWKPNISPHRTMCDNSTQTDEDLVMPKVECLDACVGTEKGDDCNAVSQITISNISSGPAAGGTPSLLGNFYNNTSDTQNYVSGYEKAKLWRPANDEQAKHLDQAIDDIYRLLIVGKGCKMNSLFSEFKRVTQETLDLSKIGVPDLRSLLVQMDDEIFFKRSRYTKEIYIYPKMSSKKFEKFGHIAEFVAQQRTSCYVVPDPSSSILLDVNVRELFEPQQQYAPPLLSSTYYGSASGSNFSGYYNPNPYYSNFSYNNYYYSSYPQYQQYYQKYPKNNYLNATTASFYGQNYGNNGAGNYLQYPR